MPTNSNASDRSISSPYNATVAYIVVDAVPLLPQSVTYYLVASDDQVSVEVIPNRTYNYSADLNPVPDDETLADAEWDALFAESRDILEQLAQEAHEEYLAGLAEDFDPDNDPDAPDEL